MRQFFGFLTAFFAGAVLTMTLTSAAAEPGSGEICVDVPVFGVQICGTTTTTTTSTPSTTTTTTPTTTTTVPTTTTTVPPTTTTTVPTGDDLDLTGDLIVTDRFTFQGHIEGNGHQIVVDGGSLDWDGFTVNNVRRIIHVGDCGVSTLRNGTITNSGVTGQTGSYPLHWHLCGDTTRGTVVDNVTVRNGRNHAFVPHGSHGITIINSAAINTIDEAFWWDMPGTSSECVKGVGCGFVDNSDDIVVDNMLVDGVTSSTSRDRRMSGMLLGAGERNTVRDSHVTNVHGRTDCAGYHWPEFLGGSNRGQPVVWTFENNTADNDDCHGIFVWQNDSDIHRIVGFSGDGIDHGAYRNAYQYINVDVPYMEVHAAGVSVDGGHIGVVTVKRHRNTLQPTATFTDVQIDRFVVANSSNSGDIPGYYILINTGLSCSDIEGSGVPGTVVVVDGDAC